MDNENPDRQISDKRLEQRLRNKAMHYLSRYSSTTAKLEGVLRRFVLRKIGEVPQDQLKRCIEAVIDNCVSAGYVDDSAYIRSKFRGASSDCKGNYKSMDRRRNSKNAERSKYSF